MTDDLFDDEPAYSYDDFDYPSARTEGEGESVAPLAPARLPRVGPFGVAEVAVMWGPSEPTIRRLLVLVPAPITLGGGKRVVARWPDEAAYRAWLTRASAARRAAAAPVSAKPTKATLKKKSPVSAGGVVDWSAAARALKGSRG